MKIKSSVSTFTARLKLVVLSYSLPGRNIRRPVSAAVCAHAMASQKPSSKLEYPRAVVNKLVASMGSRQSLSQTSGTTAVTTYYLVTLDESNYGKYTTYHTQVGLQQQYSICRMITRVQTWIARDCGPRQLSLARPQLQRLRNEGPQG